MLTFTKSYAIICEIRGTMNKKHFIKSIGIYFLGSVLSKIVSFLLLPLYTGLISPEHMGTYDVAIAYMSFFMSLVYLDLPIAVLRFMMDFEGKKKYIAIKTCACVFLVSTILYFVSVFISGYFLKLDFILLLALTGFFQTLTLYYGNIARGFGYNILFSVSGLISTVISLSSTIILLTVFNFGYEVFYISIILASVISIIILEFKIKLIKHFFITKYDKVLLKNILRFCLPLCLNSAAYWFLSSINKIVIAESLSTTENGYYAIAYKFTSIITMVSTCVQYAWQELAYKRSTDQTNLDAFFTKAFSLQVRFISVATLISIPCIGLIFKIFINEQYWLSQPIIPFYLVATLLTILSSFISNSLSAIKKTNIIFVSTLISAILNTITILLLINHLGVIAGAISLAIAYLIHTIILFVFLKKILHVRFEAKLEMILFIVAIIPIIYIYINFNNIYNLYGLAISIFFSLIILRKDLIQFIKALKKQKSIDKN